AESVVEALAIDAHVLDEIAHGRGLVAARPEDLHRPLERLVTVELFAPRHRITSTFSRLILFLERLVKNNFRSDGRTSLYARTHRHCSGLPRRTGLAVIGPPDVGRPPPLKC